MDDETGDNQQPYFFNQETGEIYFGCGQGISQIHRAAFKGDSELVEELVKSGADVNMIFKTVPPMYIAVKCKHMNVIKTLIKLKADVNATTIELEQTGLHSAVSSGSLDICQVLLDNGANINQRDHDGATPLMLAATTGQINVLLFLIKRGADLNIPSGRGLSPLAAAVQNGNIEVVQCLLRYNVDVNMVDNQGNNALFHAVKGGQVEVCRLLISAGARVNQSNHAKEYPISIAAMYGNSAITDILIQAGCDVNAISRRGTPVYAAVERQHINVLRKLIKAGADVGFVAPNTRLPLTEALHQHTPSYDIILELLRAGSDIDSAICECHDSPVNMVISKCNIPIVILLLQADSKLGFISESKIEELRLYCTFTFDFIQKYDLMGAQSLKAICRKTIKRSVGTVDYQNKVEKLPSPQPMKNYLLHKDVYLPSPGQFKCKDAFTVPRPGSRPKYNLPVNVMAGSVSQSTRPKFKVTPKK